MLQEEQRVRRNRESAALRTAKARRHASGHRRGQVQTEGNVGAGARRQGERPGLIQVPVDPSTLCSFAIMLRVCAVVFGTVLRPLAPCASHRALFPTLNPQVVPGPTRLGRPPFPPARRPRCVGATTIKRVADCGLMLLSSEGHVVTIKYPNINSNRDFRYTHSHSSPHERAAR